MEAQGADSGEAIRGELIAAMKSSSREIEDALVARLRDTDLGLNLDAEDLSWLRTAAPGILAGAIAALEEELWSGPLPPVVVAHIQYVARRGGSGESLLRALWIIGSVLFGSLVAKIGELPRSKDALDYVLSWRARNTERLLSAFTAEYAKEVERLEHAPSRQLLECVQGLLVGGSEAYTDLEGYRLDACHVGLVATGNRATLECRRLAESLGCDLLALPRAEEGVWGWFGSPHRIDLARLEELVAAKGSLSIAVGESHEGLEGWRLTHREAQAAVAVAALEPPGLTRYSNVALVADALQNEATGKSLLHRYVQPWRGHQDGERLRETVRTYFDLDCNAASAASALGVDRHTVQRRLRRVEEAVGEPLLPRRTELDVALRLEHLTANRGTAPPS